jgi:membrane protease YdiL (CAAX protease family)
MVLSVMAISVPQTVEVNGVSMEVYFLISNYAVMVFDILFLIAICVCGKEKRENAGYRFRNPGKSVLFMFLFVVLYFAYIAIRMVIWCVQENDWSLMGELLKQLTGEGAWIPWINLLINIPLTFIMFFGEEYGWRYYLQPVMQNKFGNRIGVLLLGVVWAVWHIGADFMYYTTTDGPQMFVEQIIACVAFAIFFGYAYMKTNNIWVPVIMHYINNNLGVLFNGGTAQDQHVTWSDLPLLLVALLPMIIFILMPIFNKKSDCTVQER